MNTNIEIWAPDLTQHAPRSPRCRLGGFVLLPRMLDKGRAAIAGTNGEYKYNCPLDQHIVSYLGFDPEGLREQLADGKGDYEVLQWILANAKHQRMPWEIDEWSAYQLRRGPDSDAETLGHFTERAAQFSKEREDIRGWMDLLDMDDYVTFGGKP